MIGELARRAIPAAAGIALAIAAGAATGQQQADTAAAIGIDNFAFTPANLTVAPGTTITWVNHDQEPHTVVSAGDSPAKFKSPGLDTDEKFSFVFAQPGTYSYICTVHPHMAGTIIVR
jgi:plastocyanin